MTYALRAPSTRAQNIKYAIERYGFTFLKLLFAAFFYCEIVLAWYQPLWLQLTASSKTVQLLYQALLIQFASFILHQDIGQHGYPFIAFVVMFAINHLGILSMVHLVRNRNLSIPVKVLWAAAVLVGAVMLQPIAAAAYLVFNLQMFTARTKFGGVVAAAVFGLPGFVCYGALRHLVPPSCLASLINGVSLYDFGYLAIGTLLACMFMKSAWNQICVDPTYCRSETKLCGAFAVIVLVIVTCPSVMRFVVGEGL